MALVATNKAVPGQSHQQIGDPNSYVSKSANFFRGSVSSALSATTSRMLPKNGSKSAVSTAAPGGSSRPMNMPRSASIERIASAAASEVEELSVLNVVCHQA